jgi:hypothetical protein
MEASWLPPLFRVRSRGLQPEGLSSSAGASRSTFHPSPIFCFTAARTMRSCSFSSSCRAPFISGRGFRARIVLTSAHNARTTATSHGSCVLNWSRISAMRFSSDLPFPARRSFPEARTGLKVNDGQRRSASARSAAAAGGVLALAFEKLGLPISWTPDNHSHCWIPVPSRFRYRHGP